MAFNNKQLNEFLRDSFFGLLVIAGFALSLLFFCGAIMFQSVYLLMVSVIPFAVGMGALKNQARDNIFFELAYIGTGVALVAAAIGWNLLLPGFLGGVMLLPVFFSGRKPQAE